MTDTLKLTLAQLNPTVGDLRGNAEKILKVWKENEKSSDLILFPELFLCGYAPEDLVLNTAFAENVSKTIEMICNKSKAYGAAALIPTIWNEEEYHRPYNAALLIEGGEVVHLFKKHKLPNYDVFDEMRTFEGGEAPTPYKFKNHNLGIMICEDLWYPDVPLDLKEQGADILIAINASPYSSRKHNERMSVASNCTEETGLDLIYLNLIGGQDELVFDGQSFVMNAKSDVIYRAPLFEECTVNLTLDRLKSKYSIKTNSKFDNKKREWEDVTYNALKVGLRDYVHKNGFKDVVIGLSGGIDSALSAAIAVDALGQSHVRCIMMPSEFTSKVSLNDAKACADMLGVQYDILPIKKAMKTFEKIIPNLKGLAHENTQSRIRGTILMALSNISGEMVITTGNKSEMAVGYCTLYGDMNGGFNALKDVYKTDVYKLAAWRNEQSSVMPERIITKEPSAELRPNQTDQDSLPPYELLDDILKLLVEYDDIDWTNAPQDILDILDRCQKDTDMIEKVAKLLKNSEYKRYQAAPGTRITFRAFGRDRRYPMTNSFVNSIAKNT